MVFSTLVKKLSMAAAGAAFAALSAGGAAQAIIINETSDFGDSVGTEFILPAGTTEVLGTNFGFEDGDLFRFAYDALTTATLGLDFVTGDANLILFNGAGNPLFGDDDRGPGLDSEITFTFAPGEYLVGVGRNNFAGFDADGNKIIDNDTGLCSPGADCNPAGVLAFVGSESGNTGGDPTDYRLTFSIPTSGIGSEPTPVPEPASLLGLLTVGALGAGSALKRKQGQKA